MVSRGEWYQVTEKGKYEGGDKSWIKAVELKAKVSGQPLATLLGAVAHHTGLSPTALQKQQTEPKAIAKKSMRRRRSKSRFPYVYNIGDGKESDTDAERGESQA